MTQASYTKMLDWDWDCDVHQKQKLTVRAMFPNDCSHETPTCGFSFAVFKIALLTACHWSGNEGSCALNFVPKESGRDGTAMHFRCICR